MNLFYLAILSIAAQELPECGQTGEQFETEDLGACQVLLGNLAALNQSDFCDLKEIKGVLSIIAPFNITKEIKVHQLSIENIVANSLDFTGLDVQEIRLVDVHAKSLLFGSEPAQIELKGSYIDTIHGITGSQLSNLTINSSMIPFSLGEVKRINSIKLFELKLPDDFLANLQFANVVDIQHVSNKIIIIPIRKVRDLTLHENYRMERVSLPNLVYAENEIYLHHNPEVKEFSAPKLVRARLNLHEKLDSLEIPQTLTWDGEAYFNSKDFCHKYATVFRYFDMTLGTPCSLCSLPTFNITSRNLHLITGCEVVDGILVLNKRSPPNVQLGTITSVAGDLIIDGYYGRISNSRLRNVGHSLIIRNTMMLGDLIKSLKSVQSLELHEVPESLKFDRLYIHDFLKVNSSNLESLEGLVPTTLKSIVIENCPNLQKIPLLSLKNASAISFLSSSIRDLSLYFSDSFIITRSLLLKNLKSVYLEIPFEIHGDFILEKNAKLLGIQFLNQNSTPALITSASNDLLQFVKFPEMSIEYSIPYNGQFKGNFFSFISNLIALASSARRLK